MAERHIVPAQQGPVMVRTERRAVLNAIKQENRNNPKAIITRGFLRLEQVLDNRNRYSFAVVGDPNDAGVRASERRLRRPDAFYCDELAVVVGRRLLANPFGSWEPHVFGNNLLFPGATEGPAIKALMNSGKLRVEVDQVVYSSAWDLMAGRFVDVAQQGLLNGVAAAPFLADAWDRDKVFDQMTPTIRLNGGSTNNVEIWVDEPIDASSEDVDEENVLAIFMHGWYAANCGEFNAATRS